MNRSFVAVTGLLAIGALMSGMPASAQQAPAQQTPNNTNNQTQNNLPQNNNNTAPSNQNSEGLGQGAQVTNKTIGTPTGAAEAVETRVNGRRNRQNNQQTGQGAMSGANGMNSANMDNAGVSYGNATTVLERAAEMLRASRMKMADAPSGARQSYQSAVNALTQMFRAYGVNANAATSGRGVNITASQAADDVRTLRAMARNNRSGKMQQAASLYATGAKEFFTGQLREALFTSTPSVVIRGDGRPSTRGMSRSNAPIMNVPTGTVGSSVQGDPTLVDPNAVPNGDPVANPATNPAVNPNVQVPPQVNQVPGVPNSYVVTPGGFPAGAFNAGSVVTPNFQTFRPQPGVQGLGFPVINQFFPGFTYPSTFIYSPGFF